ncbi:TonB-dependent receptor [Stutzerimonas sp. VN223-3]|uniref:TonB-dependent siderophore receptor n=1 Tax=Stutzerimonas sp. VN223-3 TaxID=3384601 RepID=UPI0038B5D936
MPSFALFRPSLLAVAIAVAPMPLLAQSASGETIDGGVREYSLPAAPLSSTLNRIAAEAGLVLSIDPALTQDRMAEPVQGRFDGQGALQEALRGTGLELRQTASGSYSLQPAATDAMALPDVIVTASEALADGSEESGYRASAVRNVGALGGMELQDAPYSVTVISSELMDNIQATSSDDIFKLSPTTQFTSPTSAGYASAVAIRGFSGVGNLSIANDGLRFSNGYDGGNYIEEMERLEILSGLSGFLYGPASPGGLVNYVLKRPTYERYNSVTYGTPGGENQYLHGDFGGPIDSEGRFAYRVNLLAQDGETAIDGQVERRHMASVALDWNVSDDLLIQFDASHKQSETRGLTSYWYFDNQAFRPDADDLENDKLYSQRWAYNDSRHDRVGSRFQWRLNDVFSLRGALGYSQYTSEYAYTGPTVNSAGVYVQPLYAFAPVETEETSGNLFLDAVFDTAGIGHEMTVGYQGNTARVRYNSDYIPFPGPQYVSVTPEVPFSERPQVAKPNYDLGDGDFHLASRTQSDSVLIGDVITFNEQWSTILGVTHSRIKTFSDNFVWVEAFGSAPTIEDYSETKTSPNVSLVYKPVEWLTTYATYIEGLQTGGVAPSGTNNAGQALAPIISEQYEIGAKAELGGALFTVALFEIDKPNTFTNAANVFVQDGMQNNKGLEFGVTGNVTPALTLVGGITLLDPVVEDSAIAANEGNRPTDVARRLAKLYGEYSIFAVPGLTLTGGAFYTGEQYTDEANDNTIPSFTTFDLGGRYRMALADDHALTLRANLSNLTDEHYWLSSHYLGAPRTLELSAQLEF